jgi:poly-gamma-glutamate synthesis protein (capsule biosynthesis protein)
VNVFLCGDVMAGRGVDQLLSHPSDPRLHEYVVHDARRYVALAEEFNGPIPRSVTAQYIWGDALEELEREAPDARIVNLETTITCSDAYCLDKDVHYRMHPKNIGCLAAARIDVCTLANNHIMDWGVSGLLDTIDVLRKAGIQTAGAGRNAAEAGRPALVELPGGGRLIVLALASETSGVPPEWHATGDGPGVELIPDLSERTAAAVSERIRRIKRRGDLAIASIHWGSNWGYEVPPQFVHFAHWLVASGVDLVHGHSSHHARPIEVERGHLILYGCGDFIDDYEGIAGYEEFRGDLVVMFFARLDATSGELAGLRMVPMQIRKMRLNRPAREDIRWLAGRLALVSAPHGCSAEMASDGSIALHWRGET